jgi:hypothetical protein
MKDSQKKSFIYIAILIICHGNLFNYLIILKIPCWKMKMERKKKKNPKSRYFAIN